jgi:hypothetical protein
MKAELNFLHDLSNLKLLSLRHPSTYTFSQDHVNVNTIITRGILENLISGLPFCRKYTVSAVVLPICVLLSIF